MLVLWGAIDPDLHAEKNRAHEFLPTANRITGWRKAGQQSRETRLSKVQKALGQIRPWEKDLAIQDQQGAYVTWIPAVGLEGRYEVNERGKIRSLVCANGLRKRPRVLSPFKNGKGYLCVSIIIDGQKKFFRLNRLLMASFERHSMSDQTKPAPKPLSPEESKANIKFMSELRCHICGTLPVEVHHWKTRGAGGGDELANLVSLCPKHHREFHDKGIGFFWGKYRRALEFYRSWRNLPPLNVPEDIRD